LSKTLSEKLCQPIIAHHKNVKEAKS